MTYYDVDIIITTRLHYDHIGNHNKYKKAEIYVQ